MALVSNRFECPNCGSFELFNPGYCTCKGEKVLRVRAGASKPLAELLDKSQFTPARKLDARTISGAKF